MSHDIAEVVTNQNVEAGKRIPLIPHALLGQVGKLSLLSHAGFSRVATKVVSAAFDRPMIYQQLLSARGARDAVGDGQNFIANSAKLIGSYGGSASRITKQVRR